MKSIIRNQLQHERQIVVILDADCRIVAVNQIFANLFGKQPHFFTGKNYFDLFPNHERQTIFRGCIQNGKPYFIDASPYQGEGSIEKQGVFWDLSLLPIKADDDRVQGLVLTMKDATERVQVLRKQEILKKQLLQAQKLEAIGQLAGGIAHDFNNLLAVILGNAELARLNLDRNHPLHEDLKEIVVAAGQARDLTQRMLAFGRRQAPQKELYRARLLIDDLTTMLRRSLPKNIDLRLHTECDCLLEVDRNQILQALLNIGRNAADAMPDGGDLHIHMDHSRLGSATCPRCGEPLSGDLCRIQIVDAGMGMDAQTLSRAIEPFFTTKDVGAGTGLGLSASHGIVLLHEGHLHIDSTPGKGTRVEILLPITIESERVQDPGAAERLAPAHRILLVDDETQVRRMAARMLELAGHQVRLAGSAQDAEEIFASDPDGFDLVVLDMMMPDRDGLQLFEALKKIRPKLRAVLASGYSLDEQAQGIQKLGIGAVVQKPYSYDRFMAAIDEAMK